MATRHQISINKLWINHVGGYADQVMRPYETVATGAVIHDIENVVHGVNGQYNNSAVTGQMLGGVATSFMHPQAYAGGQILIPHGWGNPRLTFLLEVETRTSLSTVTELIQRYTDYNDPSYSGHIDPRCTFFINSITKLREVKHHTPFGAKSIQQVIDSSHVIVNNEWTGMSDWVSKNQEIPTNMRPQDIYSVLAVPQDIREHETILDLRNARSNTPVLSRRTNNLSTDYVGRVLSGYQNASASPYDAEGNVFNSAIGATQEQQLSRDPFVTALSQVTGTMAASAFTFADLQRMDPTVLDRTVVIRPQDTSMGAINYRDHSNVWTGSDAETQAAAILANGIPALMAHFGLSTLGFQATNHSVNGPEFQFTALKGFGGMDVSMYANNLAGRIQSELIDYISNYNMISYAISLQCIFTQDLQVQISLNGGPSIPYVNPTFADAMFAPVLSDTNTRLQEVSNDFELLVTQVIGEPKTPSLESISGFNI